LSEEEKLKKVIAEGKGADEWLNHPTFKHAITLRQAQLVRAFKKTKYSEQEERNEIWRKMQALDSITADLQRLIRDSRIAEKTLIQRMKDKIKNGTT
jgi:hypothetical protein